MAHKTLVGGTAYEITGGKTMVGGTAYSIAGGKTMVGGTVYDISFGPPRIKFAITGVASKTYQADEGMTWEDYINSSYNGGPYTQPIFDGDVRNRVTYYHDGHGDMLRTETGSLVYVTDSIIADYTYQVSCIYEDMM